MGVGEEEDDPIVESPEETMESIETDSITEEVRTTHATHAPHARDLEILTCGSELVSLLSL